MYKKDMIKKKLLTAVKFVIYALVAAIVDATIYIIAITIDFEKLNGSSLLEALSLVVMIGANAILARLIGGKKWFE